MQSSGFFGSQNTGSSGGGLFGNPSTTSTGNTIFGQQTQSSGIFGQSNNSLFGNHQTGSSELFGTSTSNNSMFGSQNTGIFGQTPSSGQIFGNQTNTFGSTGDNTSASMFGNQATSSNNTTGFGLFNKPAGVLGAQGTNTGLNTSSLNNQGGLGNLGGLGTNTSSIGNNNSIFGFNSQSTSQSTPTTGGFFGGGFGSTAGYEPIKYEVIQDTQSGGRLHHINNQKPGLPTVEEHRWMHMKGNSNNSNTGITTTTINPSLGGFGSLGGSLLGGNQQTSSLLGNTNSMLGNSGSNTGINNNNNTLGGNNFLGNINSNMNTQTNNAFGQSAFGNNRGVTNQSQMGQTSIFNQTSPFNKPTGFPSTNNTSIFGNQTMNNTVSPFNQSSLASSTNATTSSIFGNVQAGANQSNTGTSLFGGTQNTQPISDSSTSPFGSSSVIALGGPVADPNAMKMGGSTGGSLFGTSSNTLQTSGSLLSSGTSGSGLFGASQAGGQTSSSLFGGSNTNNTGLLMSNPQTNSSLFSSSGMSASGLFSNNTGSGQLNSNTGSSSLFGGATNNASSSLFSGLGNSQSLLSLSTTDNSNQGTTGLFSSNQQGIQSSLFKPNFNSTFNNNNNNMISSNHHTSGMMLNNSLFSNQTNNIQPTIMNASNNNNQNDNSLYPFPSPLLHENKQRNMLWELFESSFGSSDDLPVCVRPSTSISSFKNYANSNRITNSNRKPLELAPTLIDAPPVEVAPASWEISHQPARWSTQCEPNVPGGLIVGPWESTSNLIARNSNNCSTIQITANNHENLLYPERHSNVVTPNNLLAPKLTRKDYSTQPSLKTLQAYSENRLSEVEDFMIIHSIHGSILWPGLTDVRGMDFDKLVDIKYLEVSVYHTSTPPVGIGLNKQAIITLNNCKPRNREVLKPEEFRKHLKKIEDYTEKMGATFISLSSTTWQWQFQVDHFSRYCLSAQLLDCESDTSNGTSQRLTLDSSQSGSGENQSAIIDNDNSENNTMSLDPRNNNDIIMTSRIPFQTNNGLISPNVEIRYLHDNTNSSLNDYDYYYCETNLSKQTSNITYDNNANLAILSKLNKLRNIQIDCSLRDVSKPSFSASHLSIAQYSNITKMKTKILITTLPSVQLKYTNSNDYMPQSFCLDNNFVSKPFVSTASAVWHSGTSNYSPKGLPHSKLVNHVLSTYIPTIQCRSKQFISHQFINKVFEGLVSLLPPQLILPYHRPDPSRVTLVILYQVLLAKEELRKADAGMESYYLARYAEETWTLLQALFSTNNNNNNNYNNYNNNNNISNNTTNNNNTNTYTSSDVLLSHEANKDHFSSTTIVTSWTSDINVYDKLISWLRIVNYRTLSNPTLITLDDHLAHATSLLLSFQVEKALDILRKTKLEYRNPEGSNVQTFFTILPLLLTNASHSDTTHSIADYMGNSDVQTYMPEPLKDIYEVLAGKSKRINKSWRHDLASAILKSSSTDIAEIMDTYEQAVYDEQQRCLTTPLAPYIEPVTGAPHMIIRSDNDNNNNNDNNMLQDYDTVRTEAASKAQLPLENRTDLQFNILRLFSGCLPLDMHYVDVFTNTPMPLDASLSWPVAFILSLLYRTAGSRVQPNLSPLSNLFVQQLNSLGLWHWAAFVMMFFSNRLRAYHAIRDLVLRSAWNIDASDSCQVLAAENKRKILCETLGVPLRWFYESGALHHRMKGEYIEEALCWFAASEELTESKSCCVIIDNDNENKGFQDNNNNNTTTTQRDKKDTWFDFFVMNCKETSYIKKDNAFFDKKKEFQRLRTAAIEAFEKALPNLVLALLSVLGSSQLLLPRPEKYCGFREFGRVLMKEVHGERSVFHQCFDGLLYEILGKNSCPYDSNSSVSLSSLSSSITILVGCHPLDPEIRLSKNPHVVEDNNNNNSNNNNNNHNNKYNNMNDEYYYFTVDMNQLCHETDKAKESAMKLYVSLDKSSVCHPKENRRRRLQNLQHYIEASVNRWQVLERCQIFFSKQRNNNDNNK